MRKEGLQTAAEPRARLLFSSPLRAPAAACNGTYMVITCRCRADTPPRRVAGYYAPKAAGIISAQGVRPPTLIPIPFRGFGPDRHLLNNLTRYARLSIDTRARPFRPFAGPRGGTFLWPCD